MFGQQKNQQDNVAHYKELIHNLADSMQYVGEVPFKSKEDAFKVELSYEEVNNIRVLMRTLRALARNDMKNSEIDAMVPYAEVISVLTDVAQKRPNPNLSTELIAKMEELANDKQNYDEIRKIANAMNVLYTSSPDEIARVMDNVNTTASMKAAE